MCNDKKYDSGGLKVYSRRMTAHAFLVREREEIQKQLKMEKVGNL